MSKPLLVDKQQKKTHPVSKTGLLHPFLLTMICCSFLAVLVAGLCMAQPTLLLNELTPKEYKNLTYIKPFTSLVGFNGKFCKESKSSGRKKTFLFSLPRFN